MTEEEIKTHSITLCRFCGIITLGCRCPGPHTIVRSSCRSCEHDQAPLVTLTDAELNAKHQGLNLLVEGSRVDDELRRTLAKAEASLVVEEQASEHLRQRLSQTEAERDTARHHANESGNLLLECGSAAAVCPLPPGSGFGNIPEGVRDHIELLKERLEKGVSLLFNRSAETQELVDEISALKTRIANLQQKLGAAVEGYGDKP